MPNPSVYGLDPILRDVAERFDEVCRACGALYTIEQDTHNEQGYLIQNEAAVDDISSSMEDFIADRWVAMTIIDAKTGPYFKFTIKPLYEYPQPIEMMDISELVKTNSFDTVQEDDSDRWIWAYSDKRVIPPVVINRANKIVDGHPIAHAMSRVGGINGKIPVVYEDQLKGPTKAHSRRQSAFRSNFGKLRTFGRVVECKIGDKFKLSKPLMAYDNMTIIPSGTEVEVVDNDPSLPDVKYDGNTVNVSMEKLMGSINEGFMQRLERRLSEASISGMTIMIPQEVAATFSDVGRESSDGCKDCGAPTMGLNPNCDSCMGPSIESQWDTTAANESIVQTLNKLRAGEITSALQYELYAITVPSMHMSGLEEIFTEHENDEREHAKKLAKRIHELDGRPTADMCEIAQLSPIQVQSDTTPETMVATILGQEQIAVKDYKEAITLCKDDSTTRLLLEEILADEEEHLSDMKSMLGR